MLRRTPLTLNVAGDTGSIIKVMSELYGANEPLTAMSKSSVLAFGNDNVELIFRRVTIPAVL